LAELDVAPTELDGQERIGGSVEVEPAPVTRHARIGQQLVEQSMCLRVGQAAQDVAVKPLDQRGRHGFPVDDVGPEPLRVEHEAHGVEPQLGRRGWIEEELYQTRGAAVPLQDVPVAVDQDRRVRLLLAEHELERAPRLPERRRGEVGRSIHGSEAGRRQEIVPVTQGNVQGTHQEQHHLPARLGATRLDEAQMARRDVGIDGEGELAQSPLNAPFAKGPAERVPWSGRTPASAFAARVRAMARTLHRSLALGHYLGGNGKRRLPPAPSSFS
jgi:hypothetical protein